MDRLADLSDNNDMSPNGAPPNHASRPGEGREAEWIAVGSAMVVGARRFGRLLAEVAAGQCLSDTQFWILWVVGGYGDQSTATEKAQVQCGLASRLALSAAQVSGLLEQLRCRGLVEGTRCSHDRRRQQWQLTPKGRLEVNEAIDRCAAVFSPLDVALQAEDLRMLTSLLRRLERVESGMAASRKAPDGSRDLSGRKGRAA